MTWTPTRRRRTCAQLHSSWRTPPSPATSRRAPQLRALHRAVRRQLAAHRRRAKSNAVWSGKPRRTLASREPKPIGECEFVRVRSCSKSRCTSTATCRPSCPSSRTNTCAAPNHISPGLNHTRTAILHCTDAASPVADVGVGPACSAPRRSHAVSAQVHRQVERLAQRDRYGNPGDLQVSAGPSRLRPPACPPLPIPDASLHVVRVCASTHSRTRSTSS